MNDEGKKQTPNEADVCVNLRALQFVVLGRLLRNPRSDSVEMRPPGREPTRRKKAFPLFLSARACENVPQTGLPLEQVPLESPLRSLRANGVDLRKQKEEEKLVFLLFPSSTASTCSITLLLAADDLFITLRPLSNSLLPLTLPPSSSLLLHQLVRGRFNNTREEEGAAAEGRQNTRETSTGGMSFIQRVR